MIDFKSLLNNTKSTLTSPTAFSLYGVAGVVATGILTFLATKKWVELHSEIQSLRKKCFHHLRNDLPSFGFDHSNPEYDPAWQRGCSDLSRSPWANTVHRRNTA